MNSKPKNPAEWVKVSEAARQLGYCDTTIRRMIQAGQLVAVKPPRGHFRVSIASIESMIGKVSPP
jgi:excisionase family DNA binding protein